MVMVCLLLEVGTPSPAALDCRLVDERLWLLELVMHEEEGAIRVRLISDVLISERSFSSSSTFFAQAAVLIGTTHNLIAVIRNRQTAVLMPSIP